MFESLGTLKASLNFFWKKIRSHSPKTSAKDKAKAATTAGDYSPITIADTTNNYIVPHSPVKQNKALKDLKALFSREQAQHIASSINSPKRPKERQNCNDWKNFIIKKFESLSLVEQDPRYKKIITIQEDADKILQDFIKSKDENSFIDNWTALAEKLENL